MISESALPIDEQPQASKERQCFKKIAEIAKKEAGLSITAEKESMVLSRVERRMKELLLPSLESYCKRLDCDKDGKERKNLISLLTTNVTSFFREPHHFSFFRDKILPDLVQRAKSGQRVRIWSAGCSSGQEPYTLAMISLDVEPELVNLNFRILATDIDERALEMARLGEYRTQQIEVVESDMRQRYFTRKSDNIDTWCAQENIRNPIRFLPLNLLQRWPMRHEFDVIFCRNVLIYFEQETQNRVIQNFQKNLRNNGYLFLGHSERVSPNLATSFETIGNTIYSLRNSKTA